MFELTQVFALTFIANLLAKNALMMFNTFQFTLAVQPVILVGLSLLLLLYFYGLNRSQFAADYKYSTWQIEFRPLRYVVILVIICILSYGAFAMQSEVFMHGGGRRR
jgi:hypothetical protein